MLEIKAILILIMGWSLICTIINALYSEFGPYFYFCIKIWKNKKFDKNKSPVYCIADGGYAGRIIEKWEIKYGLTSVDALFFLIPIPIKFNVYRYHWAGKVPLLDSELANLNSNDKDALGSIYELKMDIINRSYKELQLTKCNLKNKIDLLMGEFDKNYIK